MLTDDWYPALAKPNVDVVTERIEAVTATGIVAGGVERAADVIVYATGFKSHGFTAPMEVAGEGGQTLEEAWAGAPTAYLGVTVPRFPNLFLIYGPHTNGGTGSVIFTIECGMQQVLAALAALDETGAQQIEVRPEAAAAFEHEIKAALPRTVWHSGCRNWYVDENGNDPNNWPYPFSSYRRRTAQLDRAAYVLT
jgi:cation diffusion facilitator CzcD-associated flavoprotein CzcO